MREEEEEEAAAATAQKQQQLYQKHESIVLFYKYFLPPLEPPTQEEIEELHSFLQKSCEEVKLKGRILLACEGINGTLSALDKETLVEFCTSLEESQNLLQKIDWKFSDNESPNEPFPDLKIAVVKEIVSTGNTVTIEDIPKYGGKHLTPIEFHKALEGDDHDGRETVVIDVRNTFEYNIGHFVPPAPQKMKTRKTELMNPEMVTFSSFNAFCDKNVESLKDKKVLMYCTGGIRCEKASAMLQKRGVTDVSQLQGGIHRYLETFRENGYFRGKNFVFDQRVALAPNASTASSNSEIVGRCVECNIKYDQLSGAILCSICRDLVLVCTKCQINLREYHCQLHQSWKECYFTFLESFDSFQLKGQLSGLEAVLKETSSRNTKRTLRKQITKIKDRISALENGTSIVDRDAPRRCRTCREPESRCDGLCWGFWKSISASDKGHEQRVGEKSSLIGARVKPGPDWNTFCLGDPSRYKEGVVIEVKSWATGGVDDSVRVLWDEDDSPNSDKIACQAEGIPRSRSSQIYRFGVLTKDLRRKYDVQLL